MSTSNHSFKPEQSKDLRQGRQSSSIFKKSDSEDFRDLHDTNKLFAGIQRHLILIVSCMVVFGIFGAYVSYLFQTTYVAEALVLYQEEEEVSTNIEGGLTVTNLSLPTVLDMIGLPKNYQAVKTALGLDLSPGEIKAMTYVPKPKNSSNLIKVVAKTKNPNLSVDIANALAAQAVKASRDFTKKQLSQTLQGYEEQLSSLRRSLAAQINEMEQFKIQNQYFDMSPEDLTFVAMVEEARKAKEKADLEYKSLLIQYENLKEEAQNVPKYVPVSLESRDSPLQQRLVNLETLLAEAKSKYTKENPKLIQLQEELNELYRKNKRKGSESAEGQFYEKNELKDQVELELMHLQGKVKSARKVKEEVEESYRKLEKTLMAFPIQQMAFVKLYHSADSTREQLKEVSKAAEAVRLMISVPKGSIELYQKAAEASPWKDGPWVGFISIIGLVFGMGVGLAGAFVLEVYDTKLRTAKQLELYYTVPCLGTVPEFSHLDRQSARKKCLFFIRNLVEGIERRSGERKMIGITSSMAKEGKSLIAQQVAAYYASLDSKTVLVQMDPKVNPLMQEEQASASAVDYLKDKSTFEEIVAKGEFDNIKIGASDPALKELLKSERGRGLFRELAERYEKIIIDCPGVIEEGYTVNLCEFADTNVFLIGSSAVRKNTVDEALGILDVRDVDLAGFLLNRVDMSYITDKRILLETKRTSDGFLSKMFSRT